MAKLYFYYSAMNAGKTTTLLQSNYNYQERGMQTVLFTPALDDRYGLGKITSRIGLAAKAHLYQSDTNLLKAIKTIRQQQLIDCMLIDEAQFLSKAQVFQLTEVVDQLHIPVLAYGLRTDYLGQPFEGSLYLLSWADSLIEIKTVCHCGRKASHVLRVDTEGRVISKGEQVAIGGNESYTSVCRRHYKNQNTGRKS